MRRLLALVLIAGCNPTEFAFSPTLNGVRSKPDNCKVDVITAPPSRDFQEVGTLDFYNGTEPKTLDAFKQAVGKQVCQVGGDAVIAIPDGMGQYTKGRVLAYTDSGAPRTGEKPSGVPDQQTDTELPK